MVVVVVVLGLKGWVGWRGNGSHSLCWLGKSKKVCGCGGAGVGSSQSLLVFFVRFKFCSSSSLI